jgi:hypothetical protein
MQRCKTATVLFNRLLSAFKRLVKPVKIFLQGCDALQFYIVKRQTMTHTSKIPAVRADIVKKIVLFITIVCCVVVSVNL